MIIYGEKLKLKLIANLKLQFYEYIELECYGIFEKEKVTATFEIDCVNSLFINIYTTLEKMWFLIWF